ncbi:mannose-6-phosphate isomerase, class I [Cellulomonas hominis]
MLTLHTTIRTYDWGSRTALPALLGVPPDGRLQAEMWFGAHPSAPSTAEPVRVLAPVGVAGVAGAAGAGPTPRRLDAVIAGAPTDLLGADVLARFGPRLPYLVKLLAAEHSLSLQVHPTAERARAGYDRERSGGRTTGWSYADPWHKPEMLVAISPVRALAGFREPADSARDLAAFGADALAPVVAVLRSPGPAAPLVSRAFGLLLALPPTTVAAVLADAPAGLLGEESLVRVLDADHPGDPGVLAALLLHELLLRPGQALVVGAGVVHCYITGVGLEVMATSDNVLRAGLTTKHLDVAEVLRVIDASPGLVPVLDPVPTVCSPGLTERRYAPGFAELEVVVADVRGDRFAATSLRRGPRIVVGLAGAVRVTMGPHASADDASTTLTGGGSVFVTDADGPIALAGTGRVAITAVPPDGAGPGPVSRRPT